MKKLLTLGALLCLGFFAQAQTARVQVIHNSPTPGTGSGPVVDIYVNGALLPPLTAVPFRAATPFLDVPSGFPLTVDVKVSPSTPADPAVATFPIGSLASGETYVVIAAGVVGDPTTPFNLFINDMAQEAASDPAKVDVAVFHGSPDAPAVDVDARTVGNLIGGLNFGGFTGYLPVDPALYYLDVRAAGDPNIVATFAAGLNGLEGGAATVFASGLLGNTPAFGLFAALPDGTVVELPNSPVARMQLIHNSPSPTVDIYVNGGLFLPNFAFRTATPYVFVDAETALDLAVVPAGGDPVNDNVYTGGPLTLENGQTYVVVADGVAGNPFFPFTLHIKTDARESGDTPENTDFLLLHGSPGAPAVDVSAFGVFTGTLVNDLTYGEFSDYVSAPAAPYIVTVAVPSLGVSIPFYVNLEGLGGGSAAVFASGLVGGNPGFGVFGALADGTVVEFPQISDYANVNIIHNSPSSAAEFVDIYLNGGLAVDDFAFRSATGFIELPAGIPLNIGVAPFTSASVADTIANFSITSGLEGGQNYIVTAAGLVGDQTYPFGLQIFAGAKLNADNPDNVDILALHSSPGAPAVDIDARAVGNLVENLAYGDYAGYLDVPAAEYFLDVRATGSPDIVATYFAPLDLFEGQALTVFASGILGGSPSFGLFATDAFGNVVELQAVEVSRGQIIHNSPSPTVDIYLNGGLAIPSFAFREATEYLFLPANQSIQVTVVPEGGDPATDAVFDAPVVFGQNGETLVIMATGIAGDPNTPFGLEVFAQGREAASAGGVDLLLYHGSTDAPQVDVVVDGAGIVLFDNVAYGAFSDDYVNVPANSYVLSITPADDNSVSVAKYTADLSSLDGGAAVVFASGFLSGSDPAFGVWVALPTGETFPLSPVSATNEIPALSDWNIFPNPVAIGQTMQLNLKMESSAWVDIRLMDAAGKNVSNVFQGQAIEGQSAWEINTGSLTPGMYFLNLVTREGVQTLKFAVAR